MRSWFSGRTFRSMSAVVGGGALAPLETCGRLLRILASGSVASIMKLDCTTHGFSSRVWCSSGRFVLRVFRASHNGTNYRNLKWTRVPCVAKLSRLPRKQTCGTCD